MKKKKRISIKMPLSSRYFIAINNVSKFYLVEMILEGSGNIDLSEFKKAVEKASSKNVGSRFVTTGFLGASKFVDSGITPRVREVDGQNWCGFGPDGAPFLKEPFPSFKEPTCEVLIIHGKKLRFSFRTSHAVMDARGTMMWVKDIFNALKGSPVVGSDPTICEEDILKNGEYIEKMAHKKFIAPTGSVDGSDFSDYTWMRKTIHGNFSKLVPNIMLLLAKEAWKYSKGGVKFAIPVDIRPSTSEIITTNNMVTLFNIEVTPNSTADDLNAIIKKRLEDNLYNYLSWENKLTRYIPIKFLEKHVRLEIAQGFKTGQYQSSGCISNVGKIDLADYTGGGFIPETVFFIPPSNNYIPFFMGLVGVDDKIEMVVTLPKILGTGGRLADAMENVEKGLQNRCRSI